MVKADQIATRKSTRNQQTPEIKEEKTNSKNSKGKSKAIEATKLAGSKRVRKVKDEEEKDIEKIIESEKSMSEDIVKDEETSQEANLAVGL